MRKTIALAVLAGLLLTSAAMASTSYTLNVYPYPLTNTYAENWVCLKGVPFQPDPLGKYDPDTGAMLDPGIFWKGDFDTTLGLIDGGKLIRLDAPTTSPKGYDSGNPGPFGACLLGDGFIMQVNDGVSHSFTYTGVEDGVPSNPADETTMTDMWISLPGSNGQEGGEHWIGNPFAHQVLFTDIKVTDGTVTLPIYSYDEAEDTAVKRGWIEKGWLYLVASTQSVKATDPEGGNGSWTLWPGHMYIVRTHKSNIALIIPAAKPPIDSQDPDAAE